MSIVRNKALIYTAHPTGHVVPGVHTRLVDGKIDLDNEPLDGAVLVKALVISSDPYMRYRMRDPSIPMFCPPAPIGFP